jgi:hypothetical protein
MGPSRVVFSVACAFGVLVTCSSSLAAETVAVGATTTTSASPGTSKSAASSPFGARAQGKDIKADQGTVTPEADPEAGGLLGPVRAGPLVGVSAPDGISMGMVARYKFMGLGLSGGYLPEVAIPGIDAKLTRMSLGGDVRIYPFGGAFFFGAAIGYAQMKGTAERTVRAYKQSSTAVGSVFASGGFVGPQLGFLWTIPVGADPRSPRIAIGTDVTLAVPFATTEPRYAVSKYGLTTGVEGTGKIAAVVDWVQSHPTPVLNLLRLGVVL